MPSLRDRTTGLPIPSPVIPLTSICLKIQVPNALEYRSALKGVLSELGKSWTWEQTSGDDNQDAYQAAELWRERISEASYLLDCEGTMSCDDVSICIAESEAVQGAIYNIVNESATPTTNFPIGQPLTSEQANTQLNPLEGCNPDELWAQCEQFVNTVYQAGIDLLEQIEVYSNALEAADLVEMLPFLGTVYRETGAAGVISTIDWTVETIQEQFIAQDTPEVRTELACQLFCSVKETTCAITVNLLWNTMNIRLGGILTPGEINDLPDLINVFTTLGTSSTIVPDIWIGFIAGAARFAGFMGVRGIDYTLNLILKIAVNDANDDWITLCEDCSPTVDPFVLPTATIPGAYTGEPYTFIENTVTGGSVWDLTFQNISGTIAIAVNFLLPSGPTCVTITAVTGTLVSYQHNLCAGGSVSGAGSGASSTVEYSQLGWFGATGGDVIRVTAEPV